MPFVPASVGTICGARQRGTQSSPERAALTAGAWQLIGAGDAAMDSPQQAVANSGRSRDGCVCMVALMAA